DVVIFIICFCFFFSSRRRHTRFKCDWSSDVALPISSAYARTLGWNFKRDGRVKFQPRVRAYADGVWFINRREQRKKLKQNYQRQIGRASCRERREERVSAEEGRGEVELRRGSNSKMW